MSLEKRRRASATRAVLLVSHETAEWLDPTSKGAALLASRAVLGPGAEDIARAATEAMRAAGGTQRRVVLALAGKLLEQRTLVLPEMTRKELQRVFPRKAAGLLDCAHEEALYAALPIAGERVAGEPAGEQKWQLVAMRRQLMVALSTALRREGIKVERIVSAPLARLCEAQRMRGATDAACIVVDADRDGVVVSLIARDELRLQNRLQGSFDAVPTMALSLIQEVKSFDGFWRKISRGTPVAQVVVLGLDSERSRLFANAIASAIPEARVMLKPDEDSAAARGALRAQAGRIESLAACAADGPFNLDLTVHIPARHAYVLSLVACLLLVTGGVGTFVHHRLSSALQATLASRTRLERGCTELEQLGDENRAAEAALAQAEAEIARQVDARLIGLPLRRALDDALRAVASGGALLSFAGARSQGLGELRVSGVVESDPLRSMQALSDIARALERSPHIGQVQMGAPLLAREPAQGGEDRDAPLGFELRATWGGDE